jgi:hypothetical protein
MTCQRSITIVLPALAPAAQAGPVRRDNVGCSLLQASSNGALLAIWFVAQHCYYTSTSSLVVDMAQVSSQSPSHWHKFLSHEMTRLVSGSPAELDN